MTMHAMWFYLRCRSIWHIFVGCAVLVVVAFAWVSQAGSTWEATAFVRLFIPLMSAVIGVTLLYEPFGDLERTATPCFERYGAGALTALTLIQATVLVACFEDTVLSAVLVRNLAAMTGMAVCIAAFLDPRQAWIVLLPFWIFVFLLDQSTYPNQMPGVIWAWPLADVSSGWAWVCAGAWIALGVIVFVVLGTKSQRGLQE